MRIFGKEFNLHIRDTVGLFLTTNKISKRIFRQNRSVFFNRAVTRKIIDYYNGDKGHQTDLRSGNLGYGFIHYAFVTNLKPKRILCIGSRKGFVPAICALACQENGFGEVDFVDPGYDIDNPNNWSGMGWWKKVNPDHYFSLLDVNQYLKTHLMTSQDFFRKSKHTYQYIYIDGDHSYKGVKSDFEMYWARLEKKGLMVFHDVVVKRDPTLPPFGVWKFWQEIKNKNKITFFDPSISGLGILQKI